MFNHDEFDKQFNQHMQLAQRSVKLAKIVMPIAALLGLGLCGFGVWAVYTLVTGLVSQ